jgi:lysine-ketoglutarate reductase/saccharopine dehydrogenase-like protein (TIGR00300 family)
MPSEIVTLQGNIIDSLILPKVLDEVLAEGATFDILALQIGIKREDPSFARINVTADSEAGLSELLTRLQEHGANVDKVEDARLDEADTEGAFPEGFYSSTNLATEIRVDAKWIPVARTEMDCGVVVESGAARTIAMGDVRPGMQIVMAGHGIRVTQLERPKGDRDGFGFMSSDVSSEKPKALLVEQVAGQMRAVKAAGKRILWVAGPAVVHTGAAPDISALVRAGFVDALFAGNGVAAHDIESHVYGTSLGVYLNRGIAADHGHEHHIRAINEVRRHGSFEAAIEAGLFSDGLVYHLVKKKSDFLFGGSVRDDGPLPEVVTDMIEVQRRLRDIIWGTSPNGDGELVGFCIVVGTMLHGIATGNCLPASVPLVCVDINQSTVTKLMDRGSFQSVGIITDVGLFIRELAEKLAPEEMRPASADAAARIAGSRTQI